MRPPTPTDAANNVVVVVTRPGTQTVTGRVIYVQGSKGSVPRRATRRRDGPHVKTRKKTKTKVRLATGKIISVDPEFVQVLEEGDS